MFQVLNGSNVEAISFNLGNALDHADRIAAHKGKPRVIRIDDMSELHPSMFDARAHKCGALCKKLANR